eukprot:2236066-Prorocentrum_lima.AAC.1
MVRKCSTPYIPGSLRIELFIGLVTTLPSSRRLRLTCRSCSGALEILAQHRPGTVSYTHLRAHETR